MREALGLQVYIKKLRWKTPLCRLRTQNSGTVSGWKMPFHAPSPWSSLCGHHGEPEGTLAVGTHNGMSAQGIGSPRTFPESSFGFLSFRVLVRNKWGNNSRCVLTPSIPQSHGTRDKVLWWLCPHPVQWALVFLLAQLLFPLSLIMAPPFFPGELLCHCSWFGCPPLANSWEHDPSQTKWNCPSGNVDPGQEQDRHRKLSELIKAGLQAPKSLSISFCFAAPLQLPWPSPLPQVLGATAYPHIKFLVCLCEPGGLPRFATMGLGSPFPAQKKPIARSREPRWQHDEKPASRLAARAPSTAPSWGLSSWPLTFPPCHIVLLHSTSSQLPNHDLFQPSSLFFLWYQVIFINLSFLNKSQCLVHRNISKIHSSAPFLCQRAHSRGGPFPLECWQHPGLLASSSATFLSPREKMRFGLGWVESPSMRAMHNIPFLSTDAF